MGNGMILFISLGVVIFIGGVIQYFLWKSRVKDKNSIEKNWNKFLNAVSKNNISEIKYYGDKLIWNKYLRQDQLTKINQIVMSKIKKYPELEELRLNAYNKQLRYDRISIHSKNW